MKEKTGGEGRRKIRNLAASRVLGAEMEASVGAVQCSSGTVWCSGELGVR